MSLKHDPQAGNGNFIITANGPVKRELVEAFIREEAARLRTQEPQEPQFA